MNLFIKIMAIIVVVIAVVYIITETFAFFGIGLDVYGNYLVWFVALVLFSMILPKTGGNIFNKKE